MDPIFFTPVVVIIVGVVFTIIMNNRHKAAKADSSVDQERGNYSSYKTELLAQDFSRLKDWMKGKPIDAFTSASIPQSTANKVQNLVTDGLKNVALSAIGMKLRRVETDAFLVLSGTDLHFLTTDKDGDLEEHLIFDNSRISRAYLQDGGVYKPHLGFYGKQAEEYLPKVHLIVFDIDGQEIALEIHDRLKFMPDASAVWNMKKQVQTRTKYQVVGELFLTELRSRFSNLKNISNRIS